MWPQRDGQSYVLLDTATTDTLVLNQSFFRPLGMQHFYFFGEYETWSVNYWNFEGMQHFYDSFALVSQMCVRRDALTLFGLNDDELLPDLHITGAGVLRAGCSRNIGQSRCRQQTGKKTFFFSCIAKYISLWPRGAPQMGGPRFRWTPSKTGNLDNSHFFKAKQSHRTAEPRAVVQISY